MPQSAAGLQPWNLPYSWENVKFNTKEKDRKFKKQGPRVNSYQHGNQSADKGGQGRH